MNNEQTYKCNGHPQVKFDVRAGTLFVRGWDGDEVRVRDDGQAKVRQRGDKIIIDSSLTCALKVYLPRTSDVYIDGTNLDIDMGGIQGEGLIDVSGGQIKIEDWQGDLEIDASSCEIHLFQCDGQASVDTGNGDVTFTACRGHLAADTGSGSVRAYNCNGSLEADTGGGDVILRHFKGPVHIDTGAGSVELREIFGRNVFVDTGGGNIDATLPGASSGRWQLNTGTGDIFLEVPENVSARFAFAGPCVELEDLGLEHRRQDGQQLTGTLNSGQADVAVLSLQGRIIARKIPIAVFLDAESGGVDSDQEEEVIKILAMLEKGTITTAEAEQLLDILRGEEDDHE